MNGERVAGVAALVLAVFVVGCLLLACLIDTGSERWRVTDTDVTASSVQAAPRP